VPKKPLIAVVDDDESVRVALTSLMRSLGFAAEAFVSADEFLASSRFRRTSCLIVDVNMPGMTGLTLHRHLRASGKNIPTILITAYPDDRVKEAASKEGAIGFLTKPFEERDLLACVHSALGNADPSG
jgi:FixJ family two-component response regulator